MQHSIALILGQIALTQPEGVLGDCPVEKQMTVHYAQTRWDGVLLPNGMAYCCRIQVSLEF